MLSGSVLLTRAELLQEAWRHYNHAIIAFCSLDRPYLCPFIAGVLTEDPVTGTTPSRLESYVFPPSELAALHTKAWSALNIIGQALEIRRITYGSTYAPVKPEEVYVVESSLRSIRDIGARLFYGLNLSLSPGGKGSNGTTSQILVLTVRTRVGKG
jgi:hypothetical protein